MVIAAPDFGAGLPAVPAEQTPLSGYPWTLRLARAGRSGPAVEIYEHGVLIDVVTATSVARLFVRGARAGSGPAGPCALAWGRMPEAGGLPAVEFRPRCWRGSAVPASPVLAVGWLWIAIVNGRLAAVTVTVAGTTYRCRVTTRGGRP